LRYPCQRNY